MARTIQCVPNFSTADATVVSGIVGAISASGASVVDFSSDIDHNRSVVTFVGEPEQVLRGSVTAASYAVRNIDITDHSGVHPRLGAIDVLPFVPITGVTFDDCIDLSIDAAELIAQQLDLPVFLYERTSPTRRSLPSIRKEAFTRIRPDFGPQLPHPTAGAVVVGCRDPLIAFNVVLDCSDLTVARAISRELRSAEISGLSGVRALALPLASRNASQVSVNITQTLTVTPLHVLNYCVRRAEEMGVSVVESELIGAMPGYVAAQIVREALRAVGLKAGQVLLANWE